mmetsp:Transcript_3848/g.5825  ORF Transcript_3848/g.5825 Transcript_3848/m.5825 type:complete len:94 (-) Transcript_3848:780-1061(-)
MKIFVLRLASALCLALGVLLINWMSLYGFYIRKTVEEFQEERPIDWDPAMSYYLFGEASQAFILRAAVEICILWVIHSGVIYSYVFIGGPLVG